MADSTTSASAAPESRHERPTRAQRLRGRVTVLEDQVEKAQARLRQAEALEKERERKRDTRRKIVLGGALLRQAREGNPAAQALIERALASLPEREKPLFAGWRPPGTEGGNGGTSEDHHGQ